MKILKKNVTMRLENAFAKANIHLKALCPIIGRFLIIDFLLLFVFFYNQSCFILWIT